MISSRINNVVGRLQKVKKNGSGWQAVCPAHEDINPSLSINEGDDGTILLYCHAGCEFGSIVESLGMNTQDLMPQNGHSANGSFKKMNIKETYDYRDEQGKLCYQALRLEPKDFRIRRPDGKGGSAWNLNGTPRVLYRLPELVKSDSDEVLICEGEKDTDCAIESGFVATTNVSGGRNWRTEYNDYLRGKNIVIIQHHDPTGQERSEVISNSIKSVTKSIKIIDFAGVLPFKGADLVDYLHKFSPADLRRLIDSAPPLEPENSPKAPAGTGKVNPPKTAKELMEVTRFLYSGTRLYRYDGGVYRKDGERYVKKSLQEKLRQKYTRSIAEEIVSFIEVANDLDHEELSINNNLVNLRNGLFHWEKGRLQDHSADYYFLTQIPVIYNEQSTCPNIDSFLNSTLPNDCLALAEELFGYCLLTDTRFEKAFMLAGSGANGKSTFISLLRYFLGRENVSTIPLQEIDEHRFKRAELFGKLANVFADLDRRALRGTSYFKTIVSGDSIDAERKFKSTFSFTPYAKLIFSANEIPHSSDNTFAFYRRWCIIPFNNKFEGEKADVNLLLKLTTPEELSGLLNRALQGLIRLIDNNGFTEPKSVLEAKNHYRKASDSAYSFLVESITPEPEKYIKKARVYERYSEWCGDSGVRALSRQRFNARLQEIYGIKPENKKGVGKIWPGIGLIDEDHIE